MSTKRVLLADDHEIIRAGLRRVLENAPDCEVAGEAATGREAVEMALCLKPDVIVLDIVMPELNGLEATRQIVKGFPEAEILILTVHESESVIREVLNAGARGYLLKSDASRHLLNAVESLSKHEPFFTPKVSEIVLAGFLSGGAPGKSRGPKQLTPREREVVQLLAEGKANKEVAALLNISVKTVETHRTNIMQKLDLHSVSELVRYAIRNDIIQA
ncbi:MAG TPA: response regulator transcription factor [Vicinamibacteria bacterium]|nr:response regulator transcription factor [Vicinamibacteria bacterium]